jgi:CubicO group peptidase (beta-lactamase class C family)
MTAGFTDDGLARLDQAMIAEVDSGAVPGIALLLRRGGQTHVGTFGALAVGGNPIQRDSIFRIASISKPMTAATALILAEDGRIDLDARVDGWLPELAHRQVLRDPAGPLDDTVPAERAITARDLLTFTAGYGCLMVAPDSTPIQRALTPLGQGGPPSPTRLPPVEEWIETLGGLPLLHQPGAEWMYNTASDILGVLIQRAAGQPLADVMRARLFDPLGMVDTGFSVPLLDIDRLATQYVADDETGPLDVYDDAIGGMWSSEPPFPAGSGGLVSTVDDVAAFATMLHHGGRGPSGPLLSAAAVAAMTTNQLSTAQRDATTWPGDYFATHGWGMGVSVALADHPGEPAGAYGWDGGFGTSWRNDPANDLVAVLLTQRMFTSPVPPTVVQNFWDGAYAALA